MSGSAVRSPAKAGPVGSPAAGGSQNHGFGYRPDIEGLRAVAVIGVILYHSRLLPVPGGFVGVDVFFVLSGYLITGLMLAEVASTGRLSLRAFWGRRVRRLLPAAVLVLAFTAVACTVVLPVTERATAAGDIRAAGLYVFNWRMAVQSTQYGADTADPSVVLHYWSLGVEEQFYLLWPVLIVLCLLGLRRLSAHHSSALRKPSGPAVTTLAGLAIGAVTAVSLAGSLWLTPRNEPLAFFNTFTRIWELALGALIATLASRLSKLSHPVRGVLAWSGLVLVAWCMLTYDDAVKYPGRAAVVPVVATALLIVGCAALPGRTSPGPGRLLSTGPMRHVGRLSYSWYLWHWPALLLPAIAVGHELGRAQTLLAVAASYLAALACYRFVESPVRTAPALRPHGRTLALGIGLTVLSLMAASLTARSAEIGAAPTGTLGGTEEITRDVFLAAPRVTVDLTTGAVSAPGTLTPSALEAAEDKGEVYAADCQTGTLSTEVRRCVFGDTDGRRTVVVFGDSHAAGWVPALTIVARHRGWKLIPITKGNCPAADFMVFHVSLQRPYPECTEWHAAAMQRIKELQPDLIIMASRWNYPTATSTGSRETGPMSKQVVGAATARMARALATMGTKVLFLRDWPTPDFTPATCVARHPKNYAACEFSRADHLPRDEATLDALAAIPEVDVVDITDVICPASQSRCPSVADNILRYRDEGHLSATYSRTLAPALLAALPAKI